MVAYLVQIITFLLALLGAFFKCVKEDSQGHPIHHRRGFPVPTKAGKIIGTLLLISFVLSMFVTFDASRDSQKTQTKLDEASTRQKQLRESLDKAMRENIESYRSVLNAQQEATERNLEKFQSVIRTQELSTLRIANKLDSTARGIVGNLSEVDSFEMSIFFEKIGPVFPESLGFQAPAGQRFADAVFQRIFCPNFRVGDYAGWFEMPIGTKPSFAVSLFFYKTDKGCETTELNLSYYGNESIPLGEWHDSFFGVDRVFFSRNINRIELRDLPSTESINMNTFVPSQNAQFHVKTRSRDDAEQLARYYNHILPRIVGFNIKPSHVSAETQSAWQFIQRRATIAKDNGEYDVSISFRKEEIHGWTFSGYLAQPTNTRKRD